tara:strand:- start:4416 stop:4565 length:150 start_codon:yes stop_codon:yes gene_type:complete
LNFQKINRIVQYFANTAQVQERLTNRIALELINILGTDDVGVIIEAKHL